MDDWGGESSTDAPLPFKRTSFGAFQTEELYQVYHCNTVAFEALAKQTARLMGKSLWRHQMETFSALPALCAGNSPVAVEFPKKASGAEFWCFSVIWDAIVLIMTSL